MASIDLTGQWTVGVTNTYGAYFPIGGVMSKGGRSILATPSTSKVAPFPALPPDSPQARP